MRYLIALIALIAVVGLCAFSCPSQDTDGDQEQAAESVE